MANSTQQHQDIDSLTERADRMLDGMTIDRQVFARDVKRMAAELAQWRNTHASKEPQKAAEGGFAGAFGDLFKDLGKQG